MTTILIAGGGTGGHLMPALAVGDAVLQLHPDWQVVFAGAERGVEAKVLPARGLVHELLPLEPLYRKQWWRNLRWPLLLPRLLHRVDALLDRVQPSAVIGTGGYASGPVVWRAARRRIPTGILDLDVRPGVTTRWLASRVNEIWLAAPEALQALPAGAQSRAVVTGAPIVPPAPERRAEARAQFRIADDLPVVVITGGSQGSLAINRAVAAWIATGGANGLHLIWVTGAATYPEFATLQRPSTVTVIPFLDPMASAWSVADLVVSRCGMSTLSEICAWGLPSILIPLPTAAADHQRFNALALERAGAAVMLEQGGLDATSLGRAVTDLVADTARRHAMSDAARQRGRPGAARAIGERVAMLAAR